MGQTSVEQELEPDRARDAARRGLDPSFVEGPSLSAEERLRQEVVEFKDRFQKQNIELDPVQKGWGPFQVLEQMVKEKKISLSDEQILAESRRIRDRDFSQNGRKHYKLDERSLRWSDREIAEKVEATGKLVRGIDVSQWQETIDWKKVKESGVQFAFMRASKGKDYVDPKFAENRSGALDVGLKIGYYHYFKPGDSVEDQIKTFVNTVGKVDNGSLRLVIDTEDQKAWAPFTPEERIKKIEEWCNGVQAALGKTPIISLYGSPNFLDESLKNDSRLAKYDLWIANYNVGEPRVPKPWTNWSFWQHSETGRVPGIKTNVDLNFYNGTDLNKAFVNNGVQGVGLRNKK